MNITKVVQSLKELKQPWYILVQQGHLAKYSKQAQLDIFKEYFSDLPKQGTQEWKLSRTGGKTGPPVIGGSEITDVIKGSIGGLIQSKLGKSDFNGNIHTQLGNLFEEVARSYFDKLHNTQTFEVGSIPGLQDEYGNTIQSYSPDGLNLLKVGPTCGASYINLMEFKCPSVRIPVEGEVPPQYIAQPKIGACTLGFVEKMTFVDSVFRKCSLKALGPNSKYTPIAQQSTKDSSAPDTFKAPIALGIIYIYNTVLPYGDAVEPTREIPIPKILSLDDFPTWVKRVWMSSKPKDPNQLWARFSHLDEKPYRHLCDMFYKFLSEERLSQEELETLGHDLGSAENTKLFNDILKLSVEGERSGQPGYKIYYGADILYDLHEADTSSYIARESRKFLEFARQTNSQPIGYIPWKLFKCVIVPMEVEKDFMDRHEATIKNVANLIWKKKLASFDDIGDTDTVGNSEPELTQNQIPQSVLDDLLG